MSFDSALNEKKSIILFTAYNEVYKPDCELHKYFFFKAENTCYEELQIFIEKNRANVSIYLTTQGIAKYYGSRTLCNNDMIRSFRLPNSTKALIQRGAYTNLVDTNSFYLDQVLFTQDMIIQVTNHDDVLKEKFDIESMTFLENRDENYKTIYSQHHKSNFNAQIHLEDLKFVLEHGLSITVIIIVIIITGMSFSVCCCRNVMSCCWKGISGFFKIIGNCFCKIFRSQNSTRLEETYGSPLIEMNTTKKLTH